MSTIELTEQHRIALGHESTEITTDELKELIDAKGNQWRLTSAGTEIIALLGQKDTDTSATSTATQKALEAEKEKNQRLQAEIEAMRKLPDPTKDSGDISQENLPYAPSTAFNIVRLAQLGFFPMDYTEGAKGNWKDISKWRYISKGIQSVYIGLGKAGAGVEKFSDKVTLTVFDTEAKWAKYHAELLKGVQKETEAWISAHPDQKPRIESARTSISAMQTAFANGKYEDGYKYATEAMDHLRMNTSNNWHTKTDTERNTEKGRIKGETSTAQTAATSANTSLENAKKQKKAAEADIEKRKAALGATDERLHTTITGDHLDAKYTDPKNGIRNIESRIIEIDRIAGEINRDPANPNVPEAIRTQFQKILNHPMMSDTAPNIRTAINAQGFQNPDGSIGGNPGNKLELAQQAMTAALKGDKQAMTQLFNNELARSTDLQLLQKYRVKVYEYVVALGAEKGKLQSLKPQVEARNIEQKELAAREKALPKYDKRVSDRGESVTGSSTKATEMATREAQITTLLDRLSNADTPNAEKLKINTELTTLIGNKNPDAVRLLAELQAAPKGPAGISQRTRAYIELMTTLGLQEGAYNKIKEHVDRAEAEIKSIQEEQKRILAEYDAAAKKASNGAELETIVAKSKETINAYNVRREGIIDSLGAEFEKAKVTLQPIQYDRLLKTSPIAKYFDKIDKFNGTMEAGKGKGIMRGMYGALMIASIGQMGMTASQDKGKAAIYAGDMAAGFIPFGIGGIYDVAVGVHSAFTGKHYATGDQVKFSDAMVRTGLGVVGIVTLGASNVLKGAAKADKIYDLAKAAMTTGKGISHGYIIWESVHLGYGLVDVGRSMVEGDIGKNWEAIKRNDPNLPAQQKWTWLTVPSGYQVNGSMKTTP